MRASTGNSDVKEMVTKFLTREQTYADLLKAIQINEKKYEDLRSQNDSKRIKLQQLQIDNDNATKIK